MVGARPRPSPCGQKKRSTTTASSSGVCTPAPTWCGECRLELAAARPCSRDLNAFSPARRALSYHAAEPETLQLVASAYLHEDSFRLGRAPVPARHRAPGRRCSRACCVRWRMPCEAERAASAHPDYGTRGEPDEMLGVVSALPLREGGSRFAGTELEDIALALSRKGRVYSQPPTAMA